jgi:hypothetical protein
MRVPQFEQVSDFSWFAEVAVPAFEVASARFCNGRHRWRSRRRIDARDVHCTNVHRL